MRESHYDISIVGAGPVGLSLGLGLARRNHSVIVLEKESSTSEHSRAPIIWPRTQEIIGELGLIDRFLDEGMPLSFLELWDADKEQVLANISFEDLEDATPYPNVLLCPQSKTEELLLNALREEKSAQVLFNAKAVDIVVENKMVKVHFEHNGDASIATSKYIVGCDGAHSTVRDIIDASFNGITYNMSAALADIEFTKVHDLKFPRFSQKRGVATAIRIDKKKWRLILPRHQENGVPLNKRITEAAEDLFPVGNYKTVWKSEFNLHRRLSSDFVKGRIILAGDAAHLTSPVGGQGMNIGIQDAHSLIKKLPQVLNQNNSNLLREYASERKSALKKGVVRSTDRLTQLLQLRRGKFIVYGLKLLGYLLKVKTIRRKILTRLSLLNDPSR